MASLLWDNEVESFLNEPSFFDVSLPVIQQSNNYSAPFPHDVSDTQYGSSIQETELMEELQKYLEGEKNYTIENENEKNQVINHLSLDHDYTKIKPCVKSEPLDINANILLKKPMSCLDALEEKPLPIFNYFEDYHSVSPKSFVCESYRSAFSPNVGTANIESYNLFQGYPLPYLNYTGGSSERGNFGNLPISWPYLQSQALQGENHNIHSEFSFLNQHGFYGNISMPISRSFTGVERKRNGIIVNNKTPFSYASKRINKRRKGYSILKPIVNKAANNSLLKKGNKPVVKDEFGKSKKQQGFKKYRIWPPAKTLKPKVEESGSISRKNQQERDRRGELAGFRERLRLLMPHTKDVGKLATINILDSAKKYCLLLQSQLKQLKFDLLVEEKKRKFLTDFIKVWCTENNYGSLA